MRFTLFFLISFFLSCSAQSFSEIKTGAKLIIKQPLTIEPGSARVLIQHNKIVSEQNLELFNPRCWFIADKIQSTEQTIKPDTFIITTVAETEDNVRLNTFALPLAFLANSSITAIDYATEFKIKSSRQPSIKHFICSHWEDPNDARHLTLKEINQTLGNFAEIQQH